ncbi:hypothetical protein EVJ58_g9389 [Rhodofomes roseus]|uniref:Methyltransferase domain-containing protein n=1 Tax=Rhodofomes roseus TaxID=34475 RepID=A0A4Y9XUY5_9APHY|nr:hypothetical protein EVJ58_g9389 [Rhodofomes roseus]
MQSTTSLGSSKSGVSRDVQDELMSKGRKRLRDMGRAKKWSLPYPLVPTDEQHVFDNWNCLFLGGLVRAVSMHHFDEPPSRVLELGCGTGVWVLEACKLWPKASFVGLDIIKCQPDLSSPDFERTELAPRVTWVNADFLEPLPFRDGQFDFVRMSHIALAVPEDEWQYLFDECARILEPGGIIEIVEDDLIFPCGRAPKKAKDDRASHSTGSPSVPPNGAFGSVSTLSFASSPSVQSSIQSSEHKYVSRTSTPPPPSAITHSSSMDSASSQPRQADQYTQKDPDKNVNKKDHTRLIKAWDAMLHGRFLAPQVSSILPFYLSTSFRDIRMMPSLHILLPPSTEQLNSSKESFDLPGQGKESPEDLAELYLSLQLHGNRLSVDRTAGASKAPKQPWKHATIASWASIHLARCLNTIRACKDAMWDAYVEGRGFGARPEADEGHLRDDFETAWNNWEADMKDRMCMRAKLHEALAWVEPGTSEQPNWKVWRERANEMEIMEFSDPFGYYISPENLCRSIKGFVGYKPKA